MCNTGLTLCVTGSIIPLSHINTMDINDELSLVISESAHSSQLESSSQWRSRVTQRHTSSDNVTPTSFVTGRGFQKKYPHLGDTKGVRIPYEISSQITEICQHLDDICGRHSVEYVHTILDKVVEGLESVP